MNLQHERMLSLCENLNLPFVAQSYAIAAQEAAQQDTAYSDFLEQLLKTETAGRCVRKQSMLTRLAGFPAIKTLEDFDYDFAAGVKRSQIDELAGLGFVLRSQTFGMVCLLLAAVAFVRSSRTLAGLAVAAGAAGLVLYNAELGAAAALIGALRAVRL